MKNEKSEIETIIEELEDYLDTCKNAPLSQTKIVVNRDEIDALVQELKTKTPSEIRRYQKIISNQEAILTDARKKADAIIEEAHVQTNELVSEHVIMQEAYARANEVVNIATTQATEMLDKATNDANDIRTAAIAYTDNLLKNVQDVIASSMDTTKLRTQRFLEEMQGYLDTVVGNRLELSPDPARTVMNSNLPNRVNSAAGRPPQTGISAAAAAKQKAEDKQAAAAAEAAIKGTPAPEAAPAENTQQEASKPSAPAPKPGDKKAKSGVDVPEQFFNKD